MIASEPQAQPRTTFFNLPPELRLIIYEILLLHPTRSIDTIHSTSSARILPTTPADHYVYEPSGCATGDPTAPGLGPSTLKIRTEDPASYALRRPQHTRSRFLIRSERFRARCMWTTYHLLSNPELSTRILLASVRVHAEAAALLYSNYTFDFDTHIEAIVPFLAGKSGFPRSSKKV